MRKLMVALVCICAATAVHAQTHLTRNTDANTITPLNGVACCDTTTQEIRENHFWRVYDLATMLPSTAYRVEAVRVAFEITDTAVTSYRIRLYSQTGGTFPAGTRTQMGTTLNISESFTGQFNNSIQIFPLPTPVDFTANSVIVVEFETLDGLGTGARFFPGSNTAGESSPTYLSSAACGIATPTPIKTLGSFFTEMILDIIGNGPEMDVQRPAGAANSIPSGGNHNLGNVSTGGQSFTLTVENTGRANLVFPGATPVTVTGTSAGTTATITQQPGTPVAFPPSSNTTTFVIQITPALNAFTVAISIDSGSSPMIGLDFNEDPYTITLSGTGVANAPAQAAPATGSSFGGASPTFTLTVQPGATLANADIELTDNETDPIQVSNITAPSPAPTGISGPTGTPGPGHPLLLQWSGTADASNPPGPYSWSITFASTTGNTTPTTITVTITIEDTAPTHTVVAPTTGDGSSGTPYAATFTEGQTVTNADIATVTDLNTGQTLALGTVTDTGGTATGTGFDSTSFTLVGTALRVSSVGALAAADVGTHTFTVDVTDGGANTVTIYVTLTVNPNTAPTLTAGGTHNVVRGAAPVNVQVGTANDAEDPETALVVSVVGTLPTGITVANLSVDALGNVTADLSATTAATLGANIVTIRVTDTASATSPDVTFTVNIQGSGGGTQVGGGGSGGGGGGGGCSAAAVPVAPVLFGLFAIAALRRRRR